VFRPRARRPRQTPKPAKKTSASGDARLRLGGEVELHLGRVLSGGRSGEIGLFLEAEHRGVKDGGHAFDRGVVGKGGVVESASLDRDPVFAALKLGLQGSEIAGGLEIGVALGDDKQSGESGTKAALRSLKLGELRGVGRSLGRVERDLADRSAGLGDGGEGGLLEVRRASDGVDEIRNEIGAREVFFIFRRKLD